MRALVDRQWRFEDVIDGECQKRSGMNLYAIRHFWCAPTFLKSPAFTIESWPWVYVAAKCFAHRDAWIEETAARAHPNARPASLSRELAGWNVADRGARRKCLHDFLGRRPNLRSVAFQIDVHLVLADHALNSLDIEDGADKLQMVQFETFRHDFKSRG